jgi:hypothetical protein
MSRNSRNQGTTKVVIKVSSARVFSATLAVGLGIFVIRISNDVFDVLCERYKDDIENLRNRVLRAGDEVKDAWKEGQRLSNESE